MGITAGQRRGHEIDGPRASASARPISGLVRKSLFTIDAPRATALGRRPQARRRTTGMTDALSCREFAVEIVRRLRQAGYQSLWAGGCVRDLLLGETPADYDVATDATPEQVMAVLPYHAVTVGIAFGVVRVRHPGRPGIEVEVATFRSDGAYVDGRRPESVVFSSPQLDAERRDFTINGMFMDPITGALIDYVGGHEDLKKHLLRAIGDPADRLREDRLRALRAIRLAARFGLQIDPATLAALRSMAGEVVTVSPERIAQELRRMLVHESRASHEPGLRFGTHRRGAIPPGGVERGIPRRAHPLRS